MKKSFSISLFSCLFLALSVSASNESFGDITTLNGETQLPEATSAAVTKITVFGRGGVRRARVCPRSSILVCAEIDTEAIQSDPGSPIPGAGAPVKGEMVVFEDVAGETVEIFRGNVQLLSVGDNNQGATVRFLD